MLPLKNFLFQVKTTMTPLGVSIGIGAFTFLLSSAVTAQVVSEKVVYEEPIEEVSVSADFFSSNLFSLGSSVSVIDTETIQQNNAVHLDELLSLAPNVNFSSGASRGRFIQIRGVGERSEFVEPLNPSVGILIDGIDFTGIGTAATTMDVAQVEILRGPQGTLYGANALAGLINIVSTDPTDQRVGHASVSLSEYDTQMLQGAVTTPISDGLSARWSVQQHSSDGYIRNAFLGRNDTNNLDELTLRSKWLWQANDRLEIQVSGFWADIDNGYDAFSLDNNRTTLSDNPGFDRQETKAASLSADWVLVNGLTLQTLVSTAQSDLAYGFDEDWTYIDIHPDGYSSFDNYQRDNRNTVVDIRLLSEEGAEPTSWVFGVYRRDQQVDLHRDYTFAPAPFVSYFDTVNSAIYGQVDIFLTETLSLTTGLRYERRQADYRDNDAVNLNPKENLWGGKLLLAYQYSGDTLAYGLISRGYKAGGFNIS